MRLSAFASEGLLRVIRLLENLPDQKFDLSRWCHDAGCGTTYCAMGLAATQPWFRQQGLSLSDQGGIQLQDPKGTVWTDFAAAAHFFHISENQATFLFMPDPRSYFPRKQVIARLLKFVAREGEMGMFYDRYAVDLTEAEQARIDDMLAALDAKLALEKEALEKEEKPASLLHQVLFKGDALVPDVV